MYYITETPLLFFFFFSGCPRLDWLGIAGPSLLSLSPLFRLSFSSSFFKKIFWKILKKLSLFFCVGDSTFLSFLCVVVYIRSWFPPPPSSSCHQFRFLLLFHFFSFRRDGVAVVQLEKTQEPKEKRKRHDEVREWGGRVSTVDTIQSILTFRRAPSLYKSSDGRKRRTFSFVVPDEKKEKKNICRRQSWIINGTDRRTRGEGPNLGGIDPPAPLRLYTPPHGQRSAAYYITRERKEEPGGKLCSGFSWLHDVQWGGKKKREMKGFFQDDTLSRH